MSTKICMSAWNGGPWETKDTVTLGQLTQMVAALYGLGYDIDTPATYLFDDEHVWLETVEFDEGIEEEAAEGPRVVDSLEHEHRHSQWLDRDGSRWRYYLPGCGIGVWEYFWEYGGKWAEAEPIEYYAPYTEVVE